MKFKLRIIVSGLIAQHFQLGGVTWDYLNVLLGLKEMGHEVYYLEDSCESPYKLDGTTGSDARIEDCKNNIEYLDYVLKKYDIQDNWAYAFPLWSDKNVISKKWYGLSDLKRNELIDSADILINVSGSIYRPEEYRNVDKLIYFDTDPVFTQIRIANNDRELIEKIEVHDSFIFTGESNLSCNLPPTKFDWVGTRHPIFLPEWTKNNCGNKIGENYTTIMNWTSYKPVVYKNEKYCQKDEEFNKFLNLPSYFKELIFEVSMPVTEHKYWQSDGEKQSSNYKIGEPANSPQELLIKNGWNVRNSLYTCSNCMDYRDYIFNSKAEWSVAKNGYVKGNVGWFSGRSACYLAAGRPVVVQDTGFRNFLPTDNGILTFNDIEECIECISYLESDYTANCKSAREIANEYFDSKKVLKDIIDL